MDKLLQPLKLDYPGFKRTFLKKKRMQWARPSIWYDADTPDTIARETEDAAIVNILHDSRPQFKYRTDIFTSADRLHETRLAADYAIEHNRNVINFLMWILILSNEHCRRMLVLSGWRKANVEENDPHITIHNRAVNIDPKRIARVMTGMKKPCPGKHHNQATCERVTTSNHDLCWSCHQVWPTRETMPDWMVAVVRDDWREFRKRAIESLYHLEYIEYDNDEAAA